MAELLNNGSKEGASRTGGGVANGTRVVKWRLDGRLCGNAQRRLCDRVCASFWTPYDAKMPTQFR